MRRAWLAGAALVVSACGGAPVGGGGERRDGPLWVSSVPPWCDLADLAGTVDGVDHPDALGVAVYLHVGGRWWSKPTRAAPVTPVAADGTWRVDVTTGGHDAAATRFEVFLVPRGFRVPIAAPMDELPPGLAEAAIARVGIDRAPRTERAIRFSGRDWTVRDSCGHEAGPGDNVWRGGQDAVWVDAQGRLHLAMTRVNGRWHGAEVRTRVSGEGQYVFELERGPDLEASSAILGLFTYDFEREPRRELDVEIGRWGDPAGPDLQFVVQPWQRAGNRARFAPALGQAPSTHTISWARGAVSFRSVDAEGREVGSLAYAGPDAPGLGPLWAVINLWPAAGATTGGDREVEVVIARFEHGPVTGTSQPVD